MFWNDFVKKCEKVLFVKIFLFYAELLYGKIRKFGTDFPIFGTDFLIHVRFPYYMYARAYSAYARK